MATTLLINSRSYQTRVALVSSGSLLELYQERTIRGGLAGNVYLGRVARVLPGMQAAFVDIGLAKAAFLYVGDVHHPPVMSDLLNGDQVQKPESGHTQIEDMLSEGQDLLVQVSKEPLGSKGARITSHITLPGRNLVFMPTVDHVGVSRRITDEQERNRLRAVIEDLRPLGAGFIARTASEGASADKLMAEMDFLVSVWDAINRRSREASPPALLHQDLSVGLRAVRDLFAREVDHLVIDEPDMYRQVREFVSTFMPRLLDSVELYQDQRPIFDAYGVESEVTRALARRVWLKSGGYLVIEKTEALTAIDVNTGRYVGGHDLEETIVKTNLEAAKEIAYQLRLRDIGGLIIIDFIDMESPANRERVVTALREALGRDRSRTKVLAMSDLGLVEMTRKRVRESLGEGLTESCFYCNGLGSIKDPATVCFEIFRALERDCPCQDVSLVRLRVHPRVAEVLLQEERYALEELESTLDLSVSVEADQGLHAEQFDMVFTQGGGERR